MIDIERFYVFEYLNTNAWYQLLQALAEGVLT